MQNNAYKPTFTLLRFFMELKDYLKNALKDEKFQKLYTSYDLAFEVGQMVLEARLATGLTQTKLAELVETKQPSIARIEDGKSLPSLSFLERIAHAFGTHLIAPRFADPSLSLRQESKPVSLTYTIKQNTKIRSAVNAKVIPNASENQFTLKEPTSVYTFAH